MVSRRRAALTGVIAGIGVIAVIAVANWNTARGRATTPTGTPQLLSTSRESLLSIVIQMRGRVAADPGDGEAAVLLADALMRSARVDGDAAFVLEAERAIRGALAHSSGDYPARRMLGAVLLAQHRFTDALEAASQAQRLRPEDAWNYAVMGDALLELGQYEKAFDAFDEVNRRRPDSGSYARAAYARELQGDISGAIAAMDMAVGATGAHDPEAQAWYLAQLGSLYLLDGRLEDADRAFKRADFVFPQHPYAHVGRARVLIAHGRHREAHAWLAGGHDTPETWALRGDLARRLGDVRTADRAYRQAERLEREGWQQEEPQPAALARFLAERRLNVSEAVALGERGASARRDIHTMDALAWAYFQAGDMGKASAAIAEALRTGTRDPRIRCHAAAIAAAAPPGDGVLACDPLEVGVAAHSAQFNAPLHTPAFSRTSTGLQ